MTNYNTSKSFSDELKAKIKKCSVGEHEKDITLGKISFKNPLILAPMASITNAPFRLLMEDLGAGGTVSELISAHGINYKNEKTLDMLYIDKKEFNVGIQIFGDEPSSLATAAAMAESKGAKFIDLNMGCPVKKVVSKGGGAALMQTPQKLSKILEEIKRTIKIPLTIKIRTGWNQTSLNAWEIIQMAKDHDVEYVVIHGRTREQKYTGLADWNHLEELASKSPLPIIGNGDLHSPVLVKERLSKTNCDGLMIGRGALRNPFIFLESLRPSTEENVIFSGKDYLEIILRLYHYMTQIFKREKTLEIQLKKSIVWFAAGFPNVSAFRGELFKKKNISEVINITEDYFLSLEHNQSYKHVDLNSPFLTSGHG